MWLYAEIRSVPDIVRHHGRVSPDEVTLVENRFSMIGHCRTLIADNKVPKQVSFPGALPVSTAGKIRKRVLRYGLWAGPGRAVG